MQAYPGLEIVVVDDRSSDGTLAIATAFAVRDPRFKIHTNEQNRGLVGNWNRCVDLAAGDWVKFVFQDDLIAPDCVARMASRVNDDTLLVACSREFEFAADTPDELRQWYFTNRRAIENCWGTARTVTAAEVCEATLDRVGANLIGEPTSVMFKRSASEKFGPFNRDLVMSCDLEYWTRLAVNAGFEWMPETLATFRVHETSTSAVNRSSRAFRMNVLDNLIIQHEFATAPAYLPLRSAASRRSPPVDLEASFRRTADWARRQVPRSPAACGDADATSRVADWEMVTRRYPLIGATRANAGWRSKLSSVLSFRGNGPKK